MIKTSHTAVRRISYSAVAATALLITAQVASAAKTAPEILAARTAATTADIESVAGIGRTTADQMGSGAVKMNGKNVKSLATFMADAIIAKTPAATGPNRPVNKADEVVEAAVQILGGIDANPKFLKLGTAKSLIVTLMKGALNTAKQTAELFTTSIFRDMGGSIALTIANNPALDANQAKIQKFLVKKSKSIAGKTNRTAIQTGLDAGFLADAAANAAYEDGNLGPVVDPETDTRPA